MRTGDADRHRIESRSSAAAAIKEPATPRGSLAGRFLFFLLFRARRLQGQYAVATSNLVKGFDRLGGEPFLLKAEIEDTFARDIEGLALLVGRAGGQVVLALDRGRVLDQGVARRYGLGLHRARTGSRTVRTAMRMATARKRSGPAGKIIHGRILGCRVVGSTRRQKKGDQYNRPYRLHNKEQ